MGRLMPVECPHGVILDWGDFGGEDSEGDRCSRCDADAESAFANVLALGLRAWRSRSTRLASEMSLHLARFVRSHNDDADAREVR